METGNNDFGGRKILIAEDTETSRYYYEMALRKCNVTVSWTRTGIIPRQPEKQCRKDV